MLYRKKELFLYYFNIDYLTAFVEGHMASGILYLPTTFSKGPLVTIVTFSTHKGA